MVAGRGGHHRGRAGVAVALAATGSAPRHLNAPSSCVSSRFSSSRRPAASAGGASSRGVGVHAAASSLAAVSTTVDPALEAAAWDLEPLVDVEGADGVEELLDEARDRAAAFAERHRGQVAELGADGLADAMHELAAIFDLTGRAGSYAMLDFTLDTADPARGALMQKARELGAAIETQLLFFELEWNQLPDERAERAARGRRARLLPPPPAQPAPLPPAPAERARGAGDDRARRDRLVGLPAALHRADLGDRRRRCPTRDEPASLEVALSRLQDPDRELREQAARATTEALRPGLRTRAYVFNTLLADKATKDRLRDYPHWLASRNLANEASDESVAALIEAVGGPLRAGAALVPAQGAAARPRPARLLGPDGAGERHRASASPTTRRARSCSTATRASRPSSARPRRASSATATSTARRGRASAAAPSARTRCPRATRT